MTKQVQGIGGHLVDRMIRRSVRRTFRNLYWKPPTSAVSEPTIFVANHHGWHDGYAMYLALSALKLRGFHDWIQEYDAFPLFGKVGGMRFPKDLPEVRAATIRKTIRLLKEGHSLILFAEGVLHRPPELMPFGKSLELLHRKVPAAEIVPVGIRYEHSMHERPEAYIVFGEPISGGDDLSRRTRLAVGNLLDRIAVAQAVDVDSFIILHAGTADVNERMDMRKIPRFGNITRE